LLVEFKGESVGLIRNETIIGLFSFIVDALSGGRSLRDRR